MKRLLLATLGLMLFVSPARATPVGTSYTGLTMIFHDLLETIAGDPREVIAGNDPYGTARANITGACNFSATAEFCPATITAPVAGYTVNTSTLVTKKWSEPETPTLWSDVVNFSGSTTTSVSISFLSDNSTDTSTLLCSGPPGSGCVGPETGAPQVAQTIVWTDANGNTITDTIEFVSDVVPEPGTMLLGGTGLLLFGITLRRRFFSR